MSHVDINLPSQSQNIEAPISPTISPNAEQGEIKVNQGAQTSVAGKTPTSVSLSNNQTSAMTRLSKMIKSPQEQREMAQSQQVDKQDSSLISPTSPSSQFGEKSDAITNFARPEEAAALKTMEYILTSNCKNLCTTQANLNNQSGIMKALFGRDKKTEMQIAIKDIIDQIQQHAFSADPKNNEKALSLWMNTAAQVPAKFQGQVYEAIIESVYAHKLNPTFIERATSVSQALASTNLVNQLSTFLEGLELSRQMAALNNTAGKGQKADKQAQLDAICRGIQDYKFKSDNPQRNAAIMQIWLDTLQHVPNEYQREIYSSLRQKGEQCNLPQPLLDKINEVSVRNENLSLKEKVDTLKKLQANYDHKSKLGKALSKRPQQNILKLQNGIIDQIAKQDFPPTSSRYNAAIVKGWLEIAQSVPNELREKMQQPILEKLSQLKSQPEIFPKIQEYLNTYESVTGWFNRQVDAEGFLLKSNNDFVEKARQILT
ncbi:MAG: hypothetical protein LBJ78_03620 [Puniceicoccales bacterium]|jgi:hypothetical protein|nr:hypothetical protein [Puniceicoccales bacterium]